MALLPIEHLYFSTRLRSPHVGTDFNREIVAASADVTPLQRQHFSRLADLTLSTNEYPELTPIISLSRVDSDTWLLTRARSLGTLRKNSHQILVHGMILRREHLELLGGNPLLLYRLADGNWRPEMAEEFPEGGGLLPPIELSEQFSSLALHERRECLSQLKEQLVTMDPSLYELLQARQRNGWPVALHSSEGQVGWEVLESLQLLTVVGQEPWTFHSWLVLEEGEEDDFEFDVTFLPVGRRLSTERFSGPEKPLELRYEPRRGPWASDSRRWVEDRIDQRLAELNEKRSLSEIDEILIRWLEAPVEELSSPTAATELRAALRERIAHSGSVVGADGAAVRLLSRVLMLRQARPWVSDRLASLADHFDPYLEFLLAGRIAEVWSHFAAPDQPDLPATPIVRWMQCLREELTARPPDSTNDLRFRVCLALALEQWRRGHQLSSADGDRFAEYGWRDQHLLAFLRVARVDSRDVDLAFVDSFLPVSSDCSRIRRILGRT